ncbi:MAG TPA: N-acetylmuramoyl-L-alanine amidase [Chitinophagaceae bacterium]|nr:N-acetylmuramoyl-L-alanine amidase [Chitinophagaceae bacterium]HPH32391.1 N-acetylmuramoyl-L-alanine amidase [Chitinophagaceae bacterium]HPN58530.1 N-acetylmuramoyl-L-alanine amidase [Chitinophagaceae bacterium]
MKKVCIAFTLLTCFVWTTDLCAQDRKKPIQTIIIDPGHGGIDPGAPGMKSTEAQLALQVSLKLGDTIAKAWPDVKLVFTRTTDVLPGNKPTKDAALKYRADLANESGGDLFIAIHLNAAGHKPGGWYERRVVNKIPRTKTVKKGKKTYKKTYYEYEYENVWVPNKAKGTETYVWAMNKNDDKVRSVNKTTDYTGEIDSTTTLSLPDPSDPSEKARMLIYAQNYFRKSLNLADLVQQEFIAAGRVNRGVKQRNDKGIWVLQATGMPSILIEIGFISNQEEEEYMNSEIGQAEIVANIFTAIKNYKEKLEIRAKPAAEVTEEATKGF